MVFLIAEAQFGKFVTNAVALGKSIASTHLGNNNHRYQRIAPLAEEQDGINKFEEHFSDRQVSSMIESFSKAREVAITTLVEARIPRDQIEFCKGKVRKLTG